MARCSLLVRAALVAAALVAAALVAAAGDAAAAQRTFVASNGSDLNPCSLPQPCRSFAFAIAQTAAGGEVIVLDSAGYGPVTISQSVSIIAPPGVYAGITASPITGNGGCGVVVNAPNGLVTLRGLTINNLGATGDGIQFNSGGALHVENVIVTGFASGLAGLTASLVIPAAIYVVDSAFRGNTNGANFQAGVNDTISIERVLFERNVTGLHLVNGRAAIRGSSLTGNTYGIDAGTGAVVEVRDSALAGNSAAGIQGTGSAKASVVSSQVTENGTGVLTAGAATVYVSDSTITRNTTGVNAGGGTVVSAGDNRLANNATDGTFSSVILKQ